MASTSQEEVEAQQHHIGEHWSGGNRIPTVQKFLEHFDKDKKERDHRIDEENRTKKERAKREQKEDKGGEQHEGKHEDVVSHQPRETSQAKMRTVTDPTTGKDIGVEDLDESSMKDVEESKVCTCRG